MSEADLDQVAENMYQMVKEYHGKKNLKALDLIKAMIEKFGEESCDKKLCKQAIRQLIHLVFNLRKGQDSLVIDFKPGLAVVKTNGVAIDQIIKRIIV